MGSRDTSIPFSRNSIDFQIKLYETITMNQKLLVTLSVVAGLVLLVAAGMYFMTPANSLPAFFPGHDMTSKIHYKHGIGALGLGLAAFALAWFKSGKKAK